MVDIENDAGIHHPRELTSNLTEYNILQHHTTQNDILQPSNFSNEHNSSLHTNLGGSNDTSISQRGDRSIVIQYNEPGTAVLTRFAVETENGMGNLSELDRLRYAMRRNQLLEMRHRQRFYIFRVVVVSGFLVFVIVRIWILVDAETSLLIVVFSSIGIVIGLILIYTLVRAYNNIVNYRRNATAQNNIARNNIPEDRNLPMTHNEDLNTLLDILSLNRLHVLNHGIGSNRTGIRGLSTENIASLRHVQYTKPLEQNSSSSSSSNNNNNDNDNSNGDHHHHHGIVEEVNNVMTEDDGNSAEQSMVPNSVCSICLDDFIEGEDLILLHCNHAYHSLCIQQWLSRDSTCPLCKQPVMSTV